MGKFSYEIELIGSQQDHGSIVDAVRKVLKENEYPTVVALSEGVVHYSSDMALGPLFSQIRGIPGVRDVKASDL